MNRCLGKRSVVLVCTCCFIAVSVSSYAELSVEDDIDKAAVLARNGKIQEAEDILLPLLKQKDTAVKAGHELGLIYYESNDLDKAVTYFKAALSAAFPEPASENFKQGEKSLLSLFDDEASAARARYELGLIYEKNGKLEAAAKMFRNALTVIANNGSVYLGISSCKKCHLKLYKSWKKTKTANSFEVLKPGVNAEAKAKLKFDPQKDYTKDAKCLECHTTGYGLPGGYRIPEPRDSKSAKQAKANAGITCEACHGPGSRYVPVLKTVMKKKRKYTQDELCQLGQFKVSARVCTTCHNLRNPTAEQDYHFNFAEYKVKDTHEHFPLKYRLNE